MAKLNQVLAIEQGIRSASYSAITELNKTAQRGHVFDGLIKTYQPINDDEAKLPPESKQVQMTAAVLLEEARSAFSKLIDVTARKDWSNCEAKADIKVDGVTVPQVPVTHLLFLEKQLTDLRTLVSNLPVLDIGENWKADPNAEGIFKTNEIQTQRTKKVQRPLVMYQATPEHPAQTQLVTEDVVAGYWNTIKVSGAIPGPEKKAVLGRIEKLLNAVKQAREEANGINEVSVPNVASLLLDYVFGKTSSTVE